MDTQNVTVSLPKEMMVRVKIIAAQRQTSISGLLASLLEHVVAQHDAFERARLRHRAWLDSPADLGTHGTARWRRVA